MDARDPRGENPRRTDAVRVLQFLTVFATGGTERQVINLAYGLDRARFDLHVACFKRWGDLLGEIEGSGWPLAEYRIRSLYGARTLRQQLRFGTYLRRHRIHVVHTFGFDANVFAIPVARLAGARAVVASIRDTGDHLTPRQRRVQRLACAMADVVLVKAGAVKERLVAEGYAAGRIAVIGNGVTLARYGRERHDGRFHRELGLAPDATLVAVVARLNRLKGIEYFLEAAAALAPRFPRARFVIIGHCHVIRDGAIVEGPYKAELEAHAARLGIGDRVVFTGFRSDVPQLLGEVAVSVLPSLSEGLSNTVLESMAAGVPVVATAVGGLPEAVEDGVSGLLVAPRDAAALGRAISSLLADGARAARLGAAGRERVREQFSDERMVRDTEQFYLALLARKGRRPAPRELEATA